MMSGQLSSATSSSERGFVPPFRPSVRSDESAELVGVSMTASPFVFNATPQDVSTLEVKTAGRYLWAEL